MERSDTIIFSHGNATDLGQQVPRVYKYAVCYLQSLTNLMDAAYLLLSGRFILQYLSIRIFWLRVQSKLKRKAGMNIIYALWTLHLSITIKSRPNERSTYADIEAAYKYAIDNLHLPRDRIILMGQSIGTIRGWNIHANKYLSRNRPHIVLGFEGTR